MNKFLAWIIGKAIGSKIKLEEGKMEDSKKWYKSKGVWAGVVAVLLGLYDLVNANIAPVFGFSLPIVPEFIYVILGALGIYSRAVAKKVIE